MRPILFTACGHSFASAPIFAGLAALASYSWFARSRDALRLSDDDFWGVIACLAAGVFVGAVGFYALLYGGGLARNIGYLMHRRALPGGSFLGAYLGAAAFAALYCRLRRLDFAVVGDVLGAAAPLGLAVMRVGCLLNGCCFGRPAALPWGLAAHPTQLYEAAGSLAIFWGVTRLPLRRGDGLLASMAAYGLLRFAVDFLRAGDPGLGAALGLTTAQWLAAAAIALAAATLARRRT